MNGIWKKTLERFVRDFKVFVKDEEVAKINRAVVEMADNCNLGMDEDDIEEFLVVPEELTDELLEQKQELVAEEEILEEKVSQENSVWGLADAFADLNKLLKKFEDMYPNT